MAQKEEAPQVSATQVENPAVSNFRRYLRIKTVQPEPDYDGAMEFLKEMAEDLNLPFKIVEPSPKRPIFIMTLEGKDPSLPSIMLNSHTDVVPVDADKWCVDPFSAEKKPNGDIYARGSQDMKCVGIQYIEAIRRLMKRGEKMLRTIHLTFMPDEEIGGISGMKSFVECEEFKKMNIAFALDEGLANPTEYFTVFYGERAPWWLKIHCTGNPGHGSRFIENTAAEKYRKIINRFLSYREEQEKRLNADKSLTLGDVTSVNLTMVEGGLQPNVIPSELCACFDVRITPTANLVEFEEMLKSWCCEAGEGVTYEFLQKYTDQTLTSTDLSDPWWNAFSSTFQKLKKNLHKEIFGAGTDSAYIREVNILKSLKTKPEIFPAATDSRYLRSLGYPALGFSPMNWTPILLHDHNEFLNEKIFLEGIEIYCHLIPNIANVK